MTDEERKFSPDEVLMGGVMMLASGVKIMRRIHEAAGKEEGVTLTWEETADLSFLITMAVAGKQAEAAGNIMHPDDVPTLRPGPYL